MISFRLTDEEYERFRRLCLSRGLRNVSELVRAAVNQLITEAGPSLLAGPLEISDRVATLESRLAELAVAVARMQISKSSDGHAPHQAAHQATGQ